MKKIQIFLKGENRTNDIVKYERNGYYYRITFKSGKTYNYKVSSVRIIEPNKEEKLIASKLDYFREIADKVGLPWTAPDGKKYNILAQNYKKISSILPETMLYNFLKGELPPQKLIKKDIFGVFFRLIKSATPKEEDFVI